MKRTDKGRQYDLIGEKMGAGTFGISFFEQFSREINSKVARAYGIQTVQIKDNMDCRERWAAGVR